MPWYEVDEDGDRILSDAPTLVAQRAKTARLKAMKESDPERYGLATDSRSVKERAESREEKERLEAKRIARRVIPEGPRSVAVPTMMTANLDSVEPFLPDPRDKADEPVDVATPRFFPSRSNGAFPIAIGFRRHSLGIALRFS